MTFNKPATHLYLKWAKDINSHICRQGEICKQDLFTDVDHLQVTQGEIFFLAAEFALMSQ